MEQGIEAQEELRGTLSGEQLEAILATLREKQAALEAQFVVVGRITVEGDIVANKYTGPAARDDAEALAIYRRVVARSCQHLPMRGVDLGASDATAAQQRLDLAQVYVGLDTKAQVPLEKGKKQKRSKERDLAETRETRSLRALEAAAQNRKLVILGDPGSGKSTFVNHLARCLAANGLDPDGEWLSHLPDWPAEEGQSLPLCVVLRDFARWLTRDRAADEPRCLWGFVVERLRAQNLEFAAEPLERVLESGECTVMLDGLDEIPTVEQRRAVRDAVASFAERYERSRFIVTCRTLSYQDPKWQLPRVPSFELSPLDEGKIGRFIEAWYRELANLGVVKGSDPEGLAQQLGQAVRQPDLWRLATNPLLLTVMALVHTHKGQLPDARALLYEETVEILLWRWEQVKAGGQGEAPVLHRLLREAGRSDMDLKRVLWRLAFDAHGQGGAGRDDALADIGELELEKALAELHPEESRDWAQEVMEVMKLRAGLLIERAPDTYTFPHRTFQEYLAGAHLSSQADFAKQATRLVAEAPFWREVALLAVGRLVHHGGDVDKPLALVGELCPKRAPRSDRVWRKVWLAGEALLEMGLNRVQDGELGRDLSDRVRRRLASLLSKGRLSPVERASAGSALAKLGDPRFRPDRYYLPDDPLLGFIEIPAGPFLMGSDKERDEIAFDGELPQHEVELSAYYMARYPVTQAQYWTFIQNTGREPPATNPNLDSHQAYAWHEGQPPPRLLNHPVVLVTWHDAMAYCDWLTKRLHELADAGQVGAEGQSSLWQGLKDERLRVRLPSEAEWEKAARGADGRLYPWGDEPDPHKANYNQTEIGSTSTVGCFPTGASPYGCEDMTGNLWEWCLTKWQNGYKDYRDNNDPSGGGGRVLRGGAFFISHVGIRCACRLADFAHGRTNLIGFRLLLSPF